MQNIDTIRTVNGYASPSCDKAHNFISRHRTAAFAEMNSHIIQSLDNNTTFGMLDCFRRFIFCDYTQHFLVCHSNRMILLVLIVHTVDDLTLF